MASNMDQRKEYKFGYEMRDEFLLDREYRFMNHGSNGATPTKVFNAKKLLLDDIEKHPDKFLFTQYPQLWNENSKAAAEFVGASPRNVVLAHNTTTALNGVLKSYPLKPGDKVLLYNWQYDSVYKTGRMVSRMTGAEVVLVKVSLPIRSSRDVVDLYKKAIEENPEIKIAVIDYICSGTAVMMPIFAIAKLCQERGVLVVVDGAHTTGQLNLNLEEMGKKGIDVFVGNLHKWAYAARGCCVMWIHPKLHDVIRPVVTSHNLDEEIPSQNFLYQGTDDVTSLLTAKPAVQFYREIGGQEATTKYITALLEEGVQYVTKAWGTTEAEIPEDMKPPFMRLVYLPHLKKFPPKESSDNGLADIQMNMPLHIHIMCEKKISGHFVLIHGRPMIRIAIQVYNTMDDFHYLAKAVKEIADEE